MQDTYLETFSDFFFNVEKEPVVKQTAQQISCLIDSLITKFGELYNEFAYCEAGKNNYVNIVLISFVRKIMEQLDAINALCSICSFDTAQIILRSLIENIVSLEYIIKEDVEKRAASYFLSHHYEEIEIGNSCFNPSTDEGSNLLSQIGTDKYNEGKLKFDKKKQAFNRLIHNNSVFSEVDNNRSQKLRGRTNAHIQWYSFCSEVKSFKQMMKEVGLEKYYSAIYGGLSLETHGLNATMALEFDESCPSIKLIRNPIGDDSVFQLTCTFALSALQSLYTYLQDGESEKEEFRKFFTDFVDKRDKTIQIMNQIKEANS